MADYYPLIARAIAGLDPSAPGESRRALYERARSALIAQLRSVQPPLTESEITRERLSLEEAVRKVESEAAQRARDASRPGGARALLERRCLPPRQRPAAGSRRPFARFSAAAPRPRRRPRATPARRSAATIRAASAISAPNRRAPRPQPPQLPMQDPVLPPTRERTGAPRRGPDNSAPQMPQPPGMRGFRDIAADADDLGRAAATANRNARKTYANVPSPSPEFDRIEPGMENRGADPEAPYSYDDALEEADRYTPQPPQMPPPQPQQRSRIGIGSDAGPKKRTRAPAVFPFKSAIAIGIVLVLVGIGIVSYRSVATMVSGLFKSSPTTEAPKDASSAPQSKPKIPDRVGQPSSSDTVAPVAQRVVLYDEDPGDPKGKQYVGSVIWRTEPIKATGNQKPDIAVRADIDIPDRKFKMTMSFRRNTDYIAAGEPHRRTDLHPAAGFLRRRRRQRARHPDEVERAGARHAAGRPRGQGHRRLLPGRPLQRRRRPHPQPAAPEGAFVVRRAAGLRQPAPRHHRDRKGRPRRARVQRRVRGVGRVGDGRGPDGSP